MTVSTLDPTVKVLAAMPGTLPELAASTGYPVGQVLSIITQARKAGRVIHAREDGVTRSVPAKAQPMVGVLTTVYEVE